MVKKRRKIDPQVISDREKKKIAKLEKAIEKQMSRGGVLKPIEEIDMHIFLKKEAE